MQLSDKEATALRRIARVMETSHRLLGPRVHAGHMQFLFALAKHGGTANRSVLAAELTKGAADVVSNVRRHRRRGLIQTDRSTVAFTDAGRRVVQQIEAAFTAG